MRGKTEKEKAMLFLVERLSHRETKAGMKYLQKYIIVFYNIGYLIEHFMDIRTYISIFFLSLSTSVFATPNSDNAFYIGGFGGIGTANHFNVSQFGTAFFTEAEGGPLAVNAFGQLGNPSAPFFGAQLGYQAPEINLKTDSVWKMKLAAELEGYTMSHRSFHGILSNNTERIPEHTFNVSYPLHRTVFLGNAILNFIHPRFIMHPYIGLGIGNALVRIAEATGMQSNPIEANVNHYNAKSSDSVSVFAGQLKVGFSYELTSHMAFFADYRRLYLASSDFRFGSTVYPTHVETSHWQVKLSSQKYNLANIGLKFKW